MKSSRIYIRHVFTAVALLLFAPPAFAQRVEVVPFGGYRGGGGVATINGSTVADEPSGPSIGGVTDIIFGPLNDGVKVEFLISHQRSDVMVNSFYGPPFHSLMEIDHVMIGGLYDLSPGRIRPFLAGLIGATWFDTNTGEGTLHFALGASAGAKFYANRHIGARIDGRVYVTIADASATGICVNSCAIGLHVSTATQFEFTAGLLFGFD